MTKKILLVDDEPDILEFLSYNLKKEKFEVTTAKNGKEAIASAKKINPDLIVLDVMMPEMDGIETCYELRKIDSLKQTLIVFLTARGEDYSQIAGFGAGADDYITKPISPKLFITKINAILKRSAVFTKEKNQTKGIIIDREKFVVIKDGKTYSLPKKEFQLLELLASKPAKVFSRQEIFTEVWGDDVVVGDRTIDVHVRKIRERLNLDAIKTVKGVGYKFEE
ncbi:MAG: response regulator transcription factor [Bacteroidales bacterium]|jgi:two-component system alkaline phosphatase synthesis response regulator PhoP|nr:response regulator transcription factor [Bacteroidales bacterium]